ncbi:MAG TPA: electron transfer flavoprotein subunit beta/FixA family protein [Selenomonadales bacterium]|nr:electron transfer flavoprotein subunit beta/FixA family protein [Selenomonadales bacterium]
MEIVVCVKQVPDTTEIRFDSGTNTLIREGVPGIVNPFDKNAVEAALQLREKTGGKVTVVTMGPPQAKNALKECIAMGADEAVLVSDRALAGADALATSRALAAAIRALERYDLIICGRQAIDGDTAQVGPGIAECLGIPQVTCVQKIELDGTAARVERETEEGYDVVESGMPLLVTVGKGINVPRYPTVRDTMKANRKEIAVMAAAELQACVRKPGLGGSPVRVRKISAPPPRAQGEVIQAESAAEAVDALLRKLSDRKVI